MREILFRGKSLETGEWVEGSLVHRTKFYGDPDDRYFIIYNGEFHCDYYDVVEVDPKTVGQYTGLCDRNGKKIFEGDVVKYEIIYDVGCYPYSETKIGMVKYIAGCFAPMYDSERSSFEVIGNIHDNPELLEVK